MRGKTTLLTCVLAGALAMPLGAAAQNGDQPGDQPSPQPVSEDRAGAHDRRHTEPLHLHCKALHHDGRDGVGCHWSPSKARDFAGYRLLRFSREEPPATVFTTADRQETRALDASVTAGTDYLYVVEAFDAAGKTIARSNPVRVHTGRPHHQRPAPRPLLPALPAA